MRWYIIRTLLHKELLRHLANRGGLVMMLLLVCASMLLAFFGKRHMLPNTQLVGGVLHCYVDYWDDGPWVEHLRNNVPPELERRITFRPHSKIARDPDSGKFIYPSGTGAIQMRLSRKKTEHPRYHVWIWDRGNPAEIAPYEKWFFKETRRHFSNQALRLLGPDRFPASVFDGVKPVTEEGKEILWYYDEAQRYFRDQVAAASGGNGDPQAALDIPTILASRYTPTTSEKDPDLQDILASALVLFALFFSCVYLLPSLTCEERERGILLAQALTPASPLEILAAKFLFYPGMGMLLGAILAGIYRPAVLISLEPVPRLGIQLPFFWLSLGASAAAFLGVGLTISSLAKTQRTASMGAMCYLLAVSLLILICQINLIPFLTNLSVENHTTLMMRSVLAGALAPWNWGGLLCTIVLAFFWCGLAVYLFRKYGWQ